MAKSKINQGQIQKLVSDNALKTIAIDITGSAVHSTVVATDEFIVQAASTAQAKSVTAAAMQNYFSNTDLVAAEDNVSYKLVFASGSGDSQVLKVDDDTLTWNPAQELMTMAGGALQSDKFNIAGTSNYLNIQSSDLTVIAAADIHLDPAGGAVNIDGNLVSYADGTDNIGDPGGFVAGTSTDIRTNIVSGQTISMSDSQSQAILFGSSLSSGSGASAPSGITTSTLQSVSLSGFSSDRSGTLPFSGNGGASVSAGTVMSLEDSGGNKFFFVVVEDYSGGSSSTTMKIHALSNISGHSTSVSSISDIKQYSSISGSGLSGVSASKGSLFSYTDGSSPANNFVFELEAAVSSGNVWGFVADPRDDLSDGSSFTSDSSFASSAINGSETVRNAWKTLYVDDAVFAGAVSGITTIAASSNATIEGIVSGAAGTFDALAGTSLALQSGGITAAGAIAGATTVTLSGELDAGSLDVSGIGDIAGLLTLSKASGTGLSVTSDATVGGDLTVTGDLTINGTTTYVDSTHLMIEDSLIELARGSGAAGSRATNINSGFYISGSTLDRDITLLGAADGGRLKVSGSSAVGTGYDVVTGGDYAINGTSVLTATTLGSAVVNSSLTSLGTQAEALNMGSYGITAAGAIAGATTISGSGQLSLAVGISAANENFTVSSGGAVVAVAGTLSGLASLDGGVNVNDALTVSTAGAISGSSTLHNNGAVTLGATLATTGSITSGGGIVAGGAISSATTVSGSGQFSMSHIDLDGTLTAGGIVSGSSFLDINHGKLRIGGTAVTANASELNLLDASAGSDTALAAADGVLFADADDSGENNLMKKATMQNIADLLGAGDGLQVNDSTAAISISYQLQHFSGSTGSAGLFSSGSGGNTLIRTGASYSGLYAPLDQEIVVGSLQVYLNGMLQVKSGSIDGTFDYELLASGSTANKLVKFAEEPEDDDAIIIQYIKK
jgi:hypothetical protein